MRSRASRLGSSRACADDSRRAGPALNGALTFPFYEEAHPDCLDPDWDLFPVCLMPPCKTHESRSSWGGFFFCLSPRAALRA
ncbi:protein of unknown function [Methylorubrum extorquens]|uniref:Uncharacterized protein n=1 Tax=Methylorubrum extorquens TaxID=408 RepID=A0A2N9ARY6_METEX|nr:protein of unknown function [Methylorubrum extorquens]